MSVGEGQILTQLRNRGPVSRAELARLTGISSAGVTKISASLCTSGILKEVPGSERSIGRPPTSLSIVASAANVLAIHLGAGRAQAAICDAQLNIKAERSMEYDLQEPVETIVAACVDLALDVCRQFPCALLGATVGVPGAVDETGRSNTHSVLAGWKNVPFAQMFEAGLGLPVTLAHNASAIAMAEAMYGTWKDADSILYLLLGRGIGGGFARQGRYERSSPVEIGHVVVNPGGPDCRCGGRGCLERYFAEEPLRRAAGLSSAATKDLVAAAMKSEQWPKIYEYFLQALSTTVTLLGPEVVILGGDFNTAPDAFIGSLRQDLSARVMPQQRENLKIERTSLAAPVGVQGAACVALEKYFYANGPGALHRIRDTVRQA